MVSYYTPTEIGLKLQGRRAGIWKISGAFMKKTDKEPN